jgi:hypothetical protein
VAEQADLRSWLTLPDLALVGRALVEPGTRQVQVQLLASTGAVVGTQDLGTVDVRPGETRFFVVHSPY